MRIHSSNVNGVGQLMPTAPLYPLPPQNSVIAQAKAWGLMGLGSCYTWTQPCEPSIVPTCGGESQTTRTTCAPTQTLFWIAAAAVGAIALFGGSKK